MGEINILDCSVFNRIAAGEVVESPAAVVKELVENSIDANATDIIVEITAGGTQSIKVTDNGKGMSKSDLPKAFLPHATSKIKTLKDLNGISTLGFRGEALPSIASVAKVTATSRKEDSETAYTVIYEDGKQTQCFESGAATGTTILVENIFENVPARKKFLKKPSAEGAKITSVIEKMILANCNVAITFLADGKKIYDSKGDGEESAIYTVYGEIYENLQKVSAIMPDITLKGYVSTPSFSKHNRNYQTLIVNGRVVENNDISYYIYVCYQDYLMKRQYPVYILYIDLPYDMVDVNVHPNKTEIKFSNMDRVKGQIFGAIKKTLAKELNIPKEIRPFGGRDPEAVKFFNSKSLFENSGINDLHITRSEKRFDGNVKLGEERQKISQTNFQTVSLGEQKSFDETLFRPIEKVEEQKSSQSRLSFYDDCAKTAIVGKLFDTYILVQKDDNLYIVDQHAAHERLLFDKYIKCIEENTLAVQDLLVPYVFEVSHSEKESVDASIEALAQAGFTISAFGGNNFSLSSVPSLCYNIDFQEFVALLLEKIRENKIKKSEFIKDVVAQSACKAAVKGKDSLSGDEIDCLLKSMIDNGGVLLCPHGRPTVIQIKKSEIEKWFKRIV